MRQSVVMSRRRFLKHTASTAGLALGAGARTQFPFVPAPEPVTLRIAGTGVNQFKELADKCKADLGFTVQYTSLVSDDVVKRAVTQPSSFDLLDSEYWMLKKIVPSGNLRGIDATKIKNYDKIVPIFTKGELPNGKKVAMQGIAPIKVAYLTGEKSKDFSSEPSQWMTVIPTVYNADTLGIRPDLINRPIESWAELLNPEFKRQILDPEHPVDRHHGRGDGVRGQRARELWRQGQHDDCGDRQDHRGDDRGQEGGAVPRLLEGIQRKRQPDGLGRGGYPIDVVAGGDQGAADGHRLRLPAAQGRLSRLGRRARRAEPSAGSDARCRLRIHQLVFVRLGWRLSQPPRLLHSRARHRETVHEHRRVGFLDGGQAGQRRHA